MFWLWPAGYANSDTPHARRESIPPPFTRALASDRAPTVGPADHWDPLAETARAVANMMADSSRDTLLRGTTFLSRTFEGLRRLFARIRAGLVHERSMLSAFGWALSPAQRLLPSTAWHLVRPGPSRRRAHGPLDAPFMVAATLADAGFAMCRGALAITTPMLPAPPKWPLLPPAPPSRAVPVVANPVAITTSWFAPMFALAAGMSAWMPAGAGVLL